MGPVGGQDAEAILAEILELLEGREGESLKASLSAPQPPEGGADVAALLGGADKAEGPCPVCGKQPCECPKGA